MRLSPAVTKRRFSSFFRRLLLCVAVGVLLLSGVDALNGEIVSPRAFKRKLEASTLHIPQRYVAKYGRASWYSVECCKYNPDDSCPTASGKSLYKLEKQQVPYCAIYGIPFGTRLRVTNRANGRSVVVVVEDRGPNKRLHRVIDLSKLAFQQIADINTGLINVKVEIL